jgi:multidrug resistance protein
VEWHPITAVELAAALYPLNGGSVTVTDAPVTTREQAVGRPLAIVLGLLTIFGPISMDLYLPVLPALTAELGSSTSTAQLTITACLLGLAIGQVIAGPLSDRFGRRLPLLIGVAAYTVTSVLCAVSPTVETLIAARFVQGLAGAVGIVIAQAAGRDVYEGAKLLRYYGRLTVLGGLAAIVGPVIGGQLAAVTDWRGVFLFLAALGVAILVACLVIFRETLPAQRRATGGFAHTLQDFRRLLADRVFVGAVLITGFAYSAIFAYLSGATFVLQGIYGLSPQGYSFAFGLNSLGFHGLWLPRRPAGRTVVGEVDAGDRAGDGHRRFARTAHHCAPAPAPDCCRSVPLHHGGRSGSSQPACDLPGAEGLSGHCRHRFFSARPGQVRLRRRGRTAGGHRRGGQRAPVRHRHGGVRRGGGGLPWADSGALRLVRVHDGGVT